MKVVHISHYDRGGAATAAIRLHLALLGMGVDSSLLTLRKTIDNLPVHHALLPDFLASAPSKVLLWLRTRQFYKRYRILLADRPRGLDRFSFHQAPYRFHHHPLVQGADIVHLHWVSNLVDVPTFFRLVRRPIVWTLHDLNAFTGGCHYAGGCHQFEQACARCPQLEGTPQPNYSATVLAAKGRAYAHIQRVVSPSAWLQGLASASALFRNATHVRIPNGFPTDVFIPQDKAFARRLLGLPLDKSILLVVADELDNRRKGLSHLLACLPQLPTNCIVCTVGAQSPSVSEQRLVRLGKIADERLMCAVYSAADGLVIPSLEDNLPNTAIEALLCGLPVVGFAVGGVPEIVQHGVNGYLSNTTDAQGLLHVLLQLLQNLNQFNAATIRADAVAKYDQSVAATAYSNLYESLTSNPVQG